MRSPRTVAAVLVCLVLLCFGATTFAQAPATRPPAVRPNNNALAKRAFDELYNMDYDPSIRDFEKLQREHPDDPFTTNYLLTAVLFKELSRIGALDSETYSKNAFLDRKSKRPLDPEVQKRFHALEAQSEALCEQRLKSNPNDVDALYARGVARGMRSTYMGMAEKSWIAAVRAALAARRDHEKVLELDPKYVDAKMTVGIHLYIIGSLNWAGRAAVALVGVTGNKQKGLEYLREVSRSNTIATNDANMALALFLRREQRYNEALQLVRGMSQQYPRNFLLALEYANLLNAAGHGRDAIAQYESILQGSKAGKYSMSDPEHAAWGLGVSLRGQREFERAAVAFDSVPSFSNVDPELAQRATVAAGEMYDMLKRRDIAVKHYEHVVSSGQDFGYVASARKHLKHPYELSQDD